MKEGQEGHISHEVQVNSELSFHKKNWSYIDSGTFQCMPIIFKKFSISEIDKSIDGTLLSDSAKLQLREI